MTSGSATSRSRSRFEPGIAALSVLLATSCSDANERERDVIATIATPSGPLELDRRVVRDIAAREQIGEDEARERALTTLRWVAARRAELEDRPTPPEHPDDLDPARRDFLERAALVRVWLHDVFEPANTAERIPKQVIAQNMAQPSMTQRLFHPEVWFVCQALIVPAEVDGDGKLKPPPSEGEAAERWRADAGQAFAPLVARVDAVADDVIAGDDCGVLTRIVAASQRTFETDSGPLALRSESFAFAPSEADSFDETWLEMVTEQATPRLVGPFATQFGLHLVVVTRIEPAALEAGSLPPEQLAAARDTKLREAIEEAWRADQLQRTLAEARDRRVVRLATEID